MITIIKPGITLASIKDCPKCTCRFSFDFEDLQTSEKMEEDHQQYFPVKYKYIECPWCKNKIEVKV